MFTTSGREDEVEVNVLKDNESKARRLAGLVVQHAPPPASITCARMSLFGYARPIRPIHDHNSSLLLPSLPPSSACDASFPTAYVVPSTLMGRLVVLFDYAWTPTFTVLHVVQPSAHQSSISTMFHSTTVCDNAGRVKVRKPLNFIVLSVHPFLPQFPQPKTELLQASGKPSSGTTPL